ncbi:MAG TPA: family 10 glycosylhydrolase [Anaerolineae bacterium]|nr:family 10 glycosylhydrolase [Anaerolineae bacterium]
MTTLTSQLKRLTLVIACALATGLGVRWALAQAVGDGDTPRATSRPIATAPFTETITYTTYLPLISRNDAVSTEIRALWVTRFDWTFYHRAVTTTDLDTIVNNAASAHFNMLLFQIRGTGDAFYSSTLEPWAARLTGETTKTLGIDPGWDPLAYMITRAHQSGLQVHAYVNMLPAWLCGVGAPTTTVPSHLFWTLSHSTTWSAWRVHSDPQTPMSIATCNDYLWATPALSLTRDHITAVAADIVNRYDVDGLHIDLIRYPGSGYSFDPFTMQAFSAALQISPSLTITNWRPGFQRTQINTLVAQIYLAVTALKPDLLVSAAVWPNYADGYNGFYQDSKGWLAGGYMDANMPMLYTSDILNDLPRWITRTQGFIDDAHGRWIVPGISGAYTETAPLFDRIAAARSMGAPGVAIFSYSGLNAGNFWADLASGPFAVPAVVPTPSWKP